MTTETETKPDVIESTKPKLHDGSGNDDNRLRHIAERKAPDSKRFNKTALCGAKVKDIHVEHNGEICQKCVEELKRRQG